MTWLGYSPVGPISWWMRHHRASGPFVVLGFFLFLGQDYGQLAPCVELQCRIQAERAHRKENSCQTMNYCSVTRRVSFWGVDQEVGSVSRITRRCAHAYIYMHFGWTCVWAHTCTHGITKSRVSPLLASGLSLAIFYTSQCQIIQCMLSQNEGKPTDCPRYRETFTFLATIRSRGGAGQKNSDLPEMPFFLWPGLWEVCAVPFGSSAALQCKHLTSSGWPLWTEQAASHEHAGACGAQSFLSPTVKGSALEDFWPCGRRTDNPPHLLQLFSASWNIERLWKILLCLNTTSSHMSSGDYTFFLAFFGFLLHF